MHRNPIVLVCSLALLACQRGDSGGDEGGPPNDGGDEGDDPARLCDLSQFPLLEPEWIVDNPSPIEGAEPTLDSLEVTDDALYIGGRHDGADSQTGYLERRAPSGELEWSVDLPDTPLSLAWDGSHLYAALGWTARRWSPDGLEDEWEGKWNSGRIEDLAVSEKSVAVVGNRIELIRDEYEESPTYTDAYFAVLSKTVPAQSEFGGRIFPWTNEIDDRVEKIVQSPWGEGWIAAGHDGDPGSGWLVGIGGLEFYARLESHGVPTIGSVIGHDDTLLVLSRVDHWDTWLSSVASTGEEFWRKEVSICGEVHGLLWDVVEHGGELWGLGRVPVAYGVLRPVLVQLDLQGTVEQVYALDSDGRDATLRVLKVSESGVYVGGRLESDGPGHRVVGKVQP